MAQPWSAVAASPEFQKLAPQEQESARQQYFDNVVAPQVPPEQRDAARQQFDTSTKQSSPQQEGGLLRNFAAGTIDALTGTLGLFAGPEGGEEMRALGREPAPTPPADTGTRGLNRALGYVGLNPDAVPATTTAEQYVRAAGTGAAGLAFPEAAVARGAIATGRAALLGATSGAGSKFGKDVGEAIAPEKYKPLAGMVGSTIGGLAGGFAPELYTRGTDWLARPIVGGLNKTKEWATGRGFTEPYAVATQRLAETIDPQRLSNNLADWRGAEPPRILDLLDNRGLRLVRSSVSGGAEDAQNLAKSYAEQVAANLQDNATELAYRLTPNEQRPVADVRTDLNKARSETARPLYEKSNRGGSIAPLQSQYEDAFNAASKASIDAQRAVNQAQAAVESAQQRTQVTDNVYAQSSAREDLRAATMAHEDAVKAQTAAEAQKAAVLDRLRTAQSDAATGARGAIWSPRIQQFLDHPIIKRGIARGYELESLDALKEGRALDPTEYAATGIDETGVPIVSKTPNMRLLDSAKKGLDAIINESKDQFGRLTEYGRAVDGVRRELVAELDRLNPDYGPARASWERNTAPIEALQAGGKAGTTRSVEYAPTIAKLAVRNPQATAAAGVGYRENIVGNIEAPKEGATGYLNRLGSSTRQTKNLTTTYGQNTAEQFQKGISDEVARANKARFIDPGSGSETFSRLQDAGVIDRLPLGGKLDFLKWALDWVKRGGALTDAEREAIAHISLLPADQATVANLLGNRPLTNARPVISPAAVTQTRSPAPTPAPQPRSQSPRRPLTYEEVRDRLNR